MRIFRSIVMLAAPLVSGCFLYNKTVGSVSCSERDSFFSNQVEPLLQSTCITCHTAGGLAGTSGFVLVAGTSNDDTAQNLATFTTVSNTKQNGVSLVMLKPTGVIAHTGGTLAPAGSSAYNSLQHMVELNASCASGTAPGAVSQPLPAVPALLPARIRRLTSAEIDASQQALFGSTQSYAASLPPDSRQSNFTRNASADIDALAASDLEAVADTMAEAAVTNNLATLAPCPSNSSSSDDQSCAQSFITTFAEKAYRRPISSDEYAALLSVYQTGAANIDPNQASAADPAYASGIELVITTVLQTPGFLYLTELGDGSVDGSGNTHLTPYETASELSYFLTGGPNITPFQSLSFNCMGGTLSNDAAGQPTIPDIDVVTLFNRVFGNFTPPTDPSAPPPPVSTGPSPASIALARGKSTLDTITGQLNSLNSRLAAPEQVILQQHLSAIRQIENRLMLLNGGGSAPGSGGTPYAPGQSCSKPGAPVAANFPPTNSQGANNNYENWGDLINQTVLAIFAEAIACDQSRFFSFELMQPSTVLASTTQDPNLFPPMIPGYTGVPMINCPSSVYTPTTDPDTSATDCDHHLVAHGYRVSSPFTVGGGSSNDSGGPNSQWNAAQTLASQQSLARVNKYSMSQMAAFGVALENYGVLDNCIIFSIDDVGNPANHNNVNLPVVILGGGNGYFKTGQFVQLPNAVDASNYGRPAVNAHNALYTSICHAFNVQPTGILTDGTFKQTGTLADAYGASPNQSTLQFSIDSEVT